jgi:hypothetical protein
MAAAGFQSKHSTSRGWRWRRCPACHAVRAAGAFMAVRYGPSWQNGEIRRACPTCGHHAPTWAFKVVRERHG